MYNDDIEEKRGFPLRDFLLKLILIIIFVLLLVWLLPMPNLKGLNNKIFNANVQEMKDAAISYFTTERLPQKVGDSVTLTLQEMLDMKLLLPFTDKDGKPCDTRKSYVTLTKMETEYELKVYLKCNKEKDYIIVHLGCYSYCTSAICEKNEEKITRTTNPTDPKNPTNPTNVGGPSCVLEITSGNHGSNGWYNSNVVVKFKSKKTTSSGATISDYGIGTSTTYGKVSSYTVSKDGTTNVYGYVKDSKGKTAVCSITVKRDTVKPSCNVGILSGTKNADGNYITDVKAGFTSKTDATSGIAAYGVSNTNKVTYNSKTSYTSSSIGKTTVYGFVKDYAGNTAVCDVSFNRIKVQEEDISNPSCSLTITSGTMGNNGWYTSDVNVGFKSKTTTNGASITAYGIGTSTTYSNNTTYKVNSDGTKTIYGYVKDSKGNTAVCSVVVKRDATRPSCSLGVTSGTYSSGAYTSNVGIGFTNKSDSTSGVNSYGIGTSTTYSNNTSYTVSTTGTHTIYGYIKDNAGNTNVCEIKVTKKDISYEYEYVKTIAEQYSAWSDWTTATYNISNPPKFESTSTKETVDLGGKSTLKGYKTEVGKGIYATQEKLIAEMQLKVCTGYKYYRNSTATTTVYAVKIGSNDGWVYQGTVSSVEQPAPDTLSKKYVYAGFNYNECNTKCMSTSPKLWKVYTRSVTTATVSDTGAYVPKGISVECKYEYQNVPVYTTTTVLVGYEEIKTPIYETIYQYKYRTRKLLNKAYTDTKWSRLMNDSSLINQGYKMTGNKRVTG